MYLVCQNHDCRQTYPAAEFKPTDRDVKCEKCGGTLISPSGEVTLSQNPYVIKTLDPDRRKRRKEQMAYGTEEWLNSLKEGDDVACNFGSYRDESYKILTVVKITPTRIFKCIHNGDIRTIYEFNNKGYQRGEKGNRISRGRLHIEPLTKEIFNKIETKDYLLNLSSLNFRELPLKYLRKFNDLYEDYKWNKRAEEIDNDI